MSEIVNIPSLISSYYTSAPTPSDVTEKIKFGTSGHRGSSIKNTFNENHIIAISQAIYEYRKLKGIDGPIFIGKDTHALSEPALRTCVSVLAAYDTEIVLQSDDGYTPTPSISNAILRWNLGNHNTVADGIVITPSHNPPTDGGFKYNPPTGGPASTEVTAWIENRANEILKTDVAHIKRVKYTEALQQHNVHFQNLMLDYIKGLGSVVDMDILSNAKLRLGVDPLGGSGVHYWDPIAEMYNLDIDVVNKCIDPTFSFMPTDHDGKIRMDCSSPWAMANLVSLKDKYDISFGNDPDYDRHGIVTRDGLMNPNSYLAVAINYLFTHRDKWNTGAMVGKTLVSSSIIDRVVQGIGRKLYEVPVGFKWFVDGLYNASLGFGGEESAGASFLSMDGTPWSTDKDGIIMDLLAAEIMAVTEKSPSEHYINLEDKYGHSYYMRKDATATQEEKTKLNMLSPENISTDTLGGEKIVAKLTSAPGNNAPIGGLKVTTENGWFAARPSGTEDVYKIYGESLISEKHLEKIFNEAQQIVSDAIK